EEADGRRERERERERCGYHRQAGAMRPYTYVHRLWAAQEGRGLVKWRRQCFALLAAFCITCNPIRERPALEIKLEGGWDDNLFFLRPARRGRDMTNHAPEEADGERERC